jgi:hypothetical protein
MRRFICGLGIAAVVVALLGRPAGAAAPPAGPPQQNLPGLLGRAWTTVLQAPTPVNPFTGGDPCVQLAGNVVAPLGPAPNGVSTCSVARGTKILFSGWTTECSTFEGNGTTEAALRACAVAADANITPSATLDGATLPLSSVQTNLLDIQLPTDNIFGTDNLTGLSVAHGYEYLTTPLKPGVHTIINNILVGDGSTQQITTRITVR